MPASAGSGSEPEESPSTEEGNVSMYEGQSTSKESAWNTFRANLTRRRQQLYSRSTSSPSRMKSSDPRRAVSLDSHPHDGPYYGPRPEDREESKFGEALAGLMQRRGYCDDDEQTQKDSGSLRRLMLGIRLDTVGRTWKNVARQTPRFIRKTLGASFRR